MVLSRQGPMSRTLIHRVCPPAMQGGMSRTSTRSSINETQSCVASRSFAVFAATNHYKVYGTMTNACSRGEKSLVLRVASCKE